MSGYLTFNAGSSSLKVARFDGGRRGLAATLERRGSPDATLVWEVSGARGQRALPPGADPTAFMLAWLGETGALEGVEATAHRLVQGGDRSDHAPWTPALEAELRTLAALDPTHAPTALALVAAVAERLPGTPQVACFDTVFHHAMPAEARLLALPRRYEALGLRRYGFHGLSYAYLHAELARLAPAEAAGRVVLAHLGSGASMCAVAAGRSVETTMGFTPAAGLVMGTRSGDLDPGVVPVLMRAGVATPEAFGRLVNQEAGLLGVSGLSADMADLLAAEAGDRRAAEAIALFCHQARKAVGALAAVLGGVDALVFSGGIGEHAAPIRERICAGLGFLGLAIDPALNAIHAPVISPAGSRASVRVIPTDEEGAMHAILRRFYPLERKDP